MCFFCFISCCVWGTYFLNDVNKIKILIETSRHICKFPNEKFKRIWRWPGIYNKWWHNNRQNLLDHKCDTRAIYSCPVFRLMCNNKIIFVVFLCLYRFLPYLRRKIFKTPDDDNYRISRLNYFCTLTWQNLMRTIINFNEEYEETLP